MLVDCPKCGFTQPEDQYCAKCGVDMQSYRPAPKALGSQLLTNPFFHITIIFILVFGGSIYIMREQRKQEIARRVDYLKNGPVYAESTSNTPANSDTSSDIASGAETFQAPVASDHIAAHAENSEGAAALESNPITAATATDTNAAAPREPAESVAETPGRASTQLKVTYALVPRAALFRMAEAGRAQGGRYVDFGEFQMGSLRNISSFMNGADVIESVQKKFLSSLGEQIWFSGEKTAEGNLGVTTKMTLRGREGQDLQGDIELMRALHELPQPGSPIVQKGYGPAEFELQPGQGLYVILVLPRVPQYDEGRFAPTKFLRIYRMSDFKQKQSEFVMFMEFD